MITCTLCNELPLSSYIPSRTPQQWTAAIDTIPCQFVESGTGLDNDANWVVLGDLTAWFNTLALASYTGSSVPFGRMATSLMAWETNVSFECLSLFAPTPSFLAFLTELDEPFGDSVMGSETSFFGATLCYKQMSRHTTRGETYWCESSFSPYRHMIPDTRYLTRSDVVDLSRET